MKSKILLAILLLAIGLSIFFTYQRSFVSRDFIIINTEEGFEEDSDQAGNDSQVEVDNTVSEEESVLPDESDTE